MTREEAAAAFARELIADWWQAVEEARAEDFVEVAGVGKLPGAALADSRLWCAEFFRPEAIPYRKELRARHAFHVAREATFDFLRHEYEVGGMPVRVLESRNFTLLRIPRADVSRVPEIAGSLLKLTGEFLFSPKTDSFSTGPFVHPMSMSSWDQRVDGGVRGGELYFLCYKRVPQRMGFPSATGWFDDEFR